MGMGSSFLVDVHFSSNEADGFMKKKKKKKFYVIRNGPNKGVYTSTEKFLSLTNGKSACELEARGFFTQRGADRFLKTGEAGFYYGVHHGEKTGVVTNPELASEWTQRVKGGSYKIFECKEDAEFFVETGETPEDGPWISPLPVETDGACPAHGKWKEILERQRKKALVRCRRVRRFVQKQTMRWAMVFDIGKYLHHLQKDSFYKLQGIEIMKHKPLPCQIYTDGASGRGWNAWAFIVYQGKRIVHSETGGGKNTIHKNVASDEAEIGAVKHAIAWMERMQLTEACIYYDNALLGNVVDGTCTPRSPVTIRYRKWMMTHLKNKNIQLQKIQGHSGISGNAIADRMAKDALMRCHQNWTEDHVLI